MKINELCITNCKAFVGSHHKSIITIDVYFENSNIVKYDNGAYIRLAIDLDGNHKFGVDISTLRTYETIVYYFRSDLNRYTFDISEEYYPTRKDLLQELLKLFKQKYSNQDIFNFALKAQILERERELEALDRKKNVLEEDLIELHKMLGE